MEEILNNIGTIVSIIIAIIALAVAIGTWLFPRLPKSRNISEFNGTVDVDNQYKFVKFLQGNDGKIVKFSVQVMDHDGSILKECAGENDRVYHFLTLETGVPEGDCISEIEVSIEPEKGTSHSPVYFAYGGYNINGFFLIRVVPGFRMGCGQVRITEVSAEQMALRS